MGEGLGPAGQPDSSFGALWVVAAPQLQALRCEPHSLSPPVFVIKVSIRPVVTHRLFDEADDAPKRLERHSVDQRAQVELLLQPAHRAEGVLALRSGEQLLDSAFHVGNEVVAGVLAGNGKPEMAVGSFKVERSGFPAVFCHPRAEACFKRVTSD
ncbi:hypothetical protein D3C78_1331900 [compost metagenome]